MPDSKSDLLNKVFVQIINFIKSVKTVYPQCLRTKDLLANLRVIKKQGLMGKKEQHAMEWYEGISKIIDKFHIRDANAIYDNTVPLLKEIDLAGKWESIEKDIVWQHLEKINAAIILWHGISGTSSGEQGYGAAEEMAANLMKDIGVEQQQDGRISMDFSRVTDYITKNITPEQLDSIAADFSRSQTGEGFGAMLKQGMSMFAKTLADGPDLPEGTRVVDSTKLDDSEYDDSEYDDDDLN